jgi:hypothetical protein
MTFQPGVVTNPNGRPVGSKNLLGREFQEAYEESKRRGYKHPYLQMMEIVNDKTQPAARRDAFLIECGRLVKPKSGFQPAISIPDISTIEDAERFLATLVLEGGPDLDPVQLSTLVKNWIESKRAGQEFELKLHAQAGSGEQHIVISGGLPDLPGCNVIMPQLNREHSKAAKAASAALPLPHGYSDEMGHANPLPTRNKPSEGT